MVKPAKAANGLVGSAMGFVYRLESRGKEMEVAQRVSVDGIPRKIGQKLRNTFDDHEKDRQHACGVRQPESPSGTLDLFPAGVSTALRGLFLNLLT
jgi:hypothetical protein